MDNLFAASRMAGVDSMQNLCLVPSQLWQTPWLLTIVELLNSKAQMIQKPAQALQKQSEKIAFLKEKVEKSNDELDCLKKSDLLPKK